MIEKREPGDLFGRNDGADGLAIALAIYVSASDSGGVGWLATWAGDNQCKITWYKPIHTKLISRARPHPQSDSSPTEGPHNLAIEGPIKQGARAGQHV